MTAYVVNAVLTIFNFDDFSVDTLLSTRSTTKSCGRNTSDPTTQLLSETTCSEKSLSLMSSNKENKIKKERDREQRITKCIYECVIDESI
jgi:hypothetical protein